MPKIEYEIFQLPLEHMGCFREEPVAGLSDYHKVYSGVLEESDPVVHNVLNELYRIFQFNRPEDYKGRSLSTSDIIKINNVSYRCQDVGWLKL